MSTPDIHPLCGVWPDMAPEDFTALKGSIEAIGLLHPVVMLDGLILDGRHRYRACVELGVEPTIVQFEGADAVAFVTGQHTRRDLSPGQRAAIAAELATRPLGWNRHSEKLDRSRELPSVSAVASMLGVGASTVRRAKAVVAASPELHHAVKAGVITLKEAANKVQAQRREQLAEVAEQERMSRPVEEQQAELEHRRRNEAHSVQMRSLATLTTLPGTLAGLHASIDAAIQVLGAAASVALTPGTLQSSVSTLRAIEAALREAAATVIDAPATTKEAANG